MSAHIIKLETFEGPLDALLSIIEQQELDISEVSLARVADQYVAYINSADIEPTEIADFLQIAAKLLLIKSRILLPFTDELESEDEGDLAEQLKEYKKFVEAAGFINSLWQQPDVSHARSKLVMQQHAEGFVSPPNVDVEVLRHHFHAVIDKLQPVVKLPERAIRKVVSLREKISLLLHKLEQRAECYFHDTLEQEADTSEKIVGFLAMLELVKQRKVTVQQDEIFADIFIKRL